MIGELKNNVVYLGQTSEGFCFKDYDAFRSKTGICYIPEHGVESIAGSVIQESDSVYTYEDFTRLTEGYIKENNLKLDAEKLAMTLFDLCTWQHPETLLVDWSTHLTD